MSNKKRKTVTLRKGDKEIHLDYSVLKEAVLVLRAINRKRRHPDEQPVIFISYSKEKGNRFARMIKSNILKLVGQDDFVFVASESIPIGADWFDAIRMALAKSQVFIIILDHDYVNNPFTNFEFGGACMARDMRVIILKIQQYFKYSHTPFSHLQIPMYTTNDENAEYVVQSVCDLFDNLRVGNSSIREKVDRFKQDVLHFLNTESSNEADFHDSRETINIK